MQRTLLLLMYLATATLCFAPYHVCFAQTGEKQPYADSLLNVIDKTSDDSVRGRLFNRLAAHYLYNNHEKALEYLDRGLKEAERYQLRFGKTELLNTKGNYFKFTGNPDSAAHYYDRALSLSRKYNFPVIEAMVLNNQGLLNWQNGKFDEALSLFFQVLELNEQKFPEEKEERNINSISNIGLIYQELSQYPKAIEYHKQALALREKYGDINGQAISYANLGLCYQSLEQHDEAEKMYEKAIATAKQAGNLMLYYSLHDNIANVYNLTGRDELAIRYYKKMLERPQEAAQPKSDMSTYINLASIYNKLKQPKTALRYAEKGLSILEAHPNLYNFSGGLHYAYAESNYMLGNIRKGSEAMLEYRKVLDSTFSQSNAEALAEVEKKYESSLKDKALLEQQQISRQKELDMRTRTIWLVVAIGLVLILASILFYLFKRKEAAARQAALELKLSEEKERSRIREERLRISRELHDNIGSYLTLFNASLEQLPDMPPEKIREHFPELKKVLSLSMQELRKTVWLLNNREITIDAMALRLRDFFKSLNQNGTHITVEAYGDTEKVLSDIQATHLFRIIQEAVNNASKHALCSSIKITLDVQANGKVGFTVTDNGKGFDTGSVSGGNGLQNMTSRMTELKGGLHIKSEAGKGTVIEGYFTA